MRIHLVAVVGLLATPVLAQETLFEANDRAPLAGFGINADIADDLSVYDSAGRKIAEVEEVLGTTADAPTALAVEFEDSVTEYGADDRIIPLTAFTFDGSVFILADGTAVADMPIWQD